MDLSTPLTLSHYQNELLAKVIAGSSSSEPVKVEMDDDKLLIAREVLNQLQLIKYDRVSDRFEITQKGLDVAREQNIIDQEDKLTSLGLDLSTKPLEQPTISQNDQPAEIQGDQMSPDSNPARNESFKNYLRRTF